MAPKKEEAKKKGKKEEPEVSEELQQLRDVAEAMNGVLYEDPEKEGIDVEEEDEDTLREAIEEAAADLTIEDKDDMDEDAWAWLEEEGMLDHLKKSKKGKKEEPKEEPKASKKGKKEEPEDDEPEEKPKKGTKKEEPKKKREVPAGFSKPKNAFGHAEGSQGAYIDDLLVAGESTLEQIEKKLAKKFDLDDAKAKGRVKSHIKHLEDEKNIEIDTDKKGIMSMDEPKVEKKSGKK